LIQTSAASSICYCDYARFAGGVGRTWNWRRLVGGIAQLLTPTPKISQDEGDPRKSFSFSGIQNTNRAGVPVPVVYGETLVGSVVISAGIDIVQVSA
jgi:predicted phage tail protein